MTMTRIYTALQILVMLTTVFFAASPLVNAAESFSSARHGMQQMKQKATAVTLKMASGQSSAGGYSLNYSANYWK